MNPMPASMDRMNSAATIRSARLAADRVRRVGGQFARGGRRAVLRGRAEQRPLLGGRGSADHPVRRPRRLGLLALARRLC